MSHILETTIKSGIDVVGISDIEIADDLLELKYKNKLVFDSAFSRQLVSFQSSKKEAQDRWYRFKEGFSSTLVKHFLTKYPCGEGRLLDPFAGSGTSLFAASDLGNDADGIELLPIGQEIIESKLLLFREFTEGDFIILKKWIETKPWVSFNGSRILPELRITNGAYPEDTKSEIERYCACLDQEKPRIKKVLLFALLCILEDISFTRKDGQYLRWDHRASRSLGGKVFSKGTIKSFEPAIVSKLTEILKDSTSYGKLPGLEFVPREVGKVKLHKGSCLEIMPSLKKEMYDVIITSPPYCNRYDYTRTYALELALLGSDEQELSSLRQQMLSCTVENRSKNLQEMNPAWSGILNKLEDNTLLKNILSYLELQKSKKLLNNSGIPRMVRGYFYEMAALIFESHRVLTKDGLLVMVNDNVRYAGASISVDLILCEVAEEVGFEVEKIIVLERGKGNSSQQMGIHGRKELRKCIYVWRKK